LSGDTAETRQSYRRLLEHGSRLKIDEVLEEKEAVERFRIDLTLQTPSLFKRTAGKKQAAMQSCVALLEIGELERQIEVMKSKRFPNMPEKTRARRYLLEQLIARGYKRKEIADRLDLSRKTVYNIIKTALKTFMPLTIFLPIFSQGRFG
jgi:putative transposase